LKSSELQKKMGEKGFKKNDSIKALGREKKVDHYL
jgi:hypothetical protein